MKTAVSLPGDVFHDAERFARRAGAPGDVLLSAESTGLPKDSVANVSQIAPC